MIKPVEIETCKSLYMHPLEIMVRDRFLELVKKHGNGIWAFEELEWIIYINEIDKYEALSNEEKFILDLYMRSFRSLYK